MKNQSMVHASRHSAVLLGLLLMTGAFVAVPAAAATQTVGPQAAAKSSAAPAFALPAEHQSAGIAYVTGGIGKAEAGAFEKAMSRYPLAIEIVQKEKAGAHEQFTADARVHVINQAGKEVFSAKAEGPFMLLRLAPGKYSIKTTYDKHTMVRNNVEVADGKTAREVFAFPASA